MQTIGSTLVSVLIGMSNRPASLSLSRITVRRRLLTALSTLQSGHMTGKGYTWSLVMRVKKSACTALPKCQEWTECADDRPLSLNTIDTWLDAWFRFWSQIRGICPPGAMFFYYEQLLALLCCIITSVLLCLLSRAKYVPLDLSCAATCHCTAWYWNIMIN